MALNTAPNLQNVTAGISAADPILVGLPLDFAFGNTSFDVSSISAAAIDQISGAIGTNLRGNLSPAYTVATNTTAASYDDTSKQFAVTSTAGLAAGDIVNMAHAAFNSGVGQPFRILAVVDITHFTVTNNIFNNLGNKTNISFQTDWRLPILAGAGGSVSSAGGTANYAKFQALDLAGNLATREELFYIRDAPAGANFISLNSLDAIAGSSGNTTTPTLNVLGAWAGRGGIITLSWANHSVQARNDFKWNDGTTTEKAVGAALGSPLTLTAGDGAKYGRLVMRSLTGSAFTVERDISYTLDSTAPTLAMYLLGR